MIYLLDANVVSALRCPIRHPAPTAWLERTLAGFADRLLGIDVPTARRWGRLSANLGHNDADLLIAATALAHGLTVVTRNLRHFQPIGVPVLNPFVASRNPPTAENGSHA